MEEQSLPDKKPDSDSPSSGCSHARAALWGLFAAILYLALQLPTINNPARNWELLLTQGYQRHHIDHWQEHGFLNERARPVIRRESRKENRGTNATHPPLTTWAVYAGVLGFGKTPLGYRMPSILATAFSAFILASYAARKIGHVAGLSASILFASLPMTFFCGRYAVIESLTLPLALLAGLLSFEQKRRWVVLGGFFWMLMSLADWTAAFLLVSFGAVNLLLTRPRWGAFRAALVCVFLAFAGFAVLIMVWDGPRNVLTTLLKTSYFSEAILLELLPEATSPGQQFANLAALFGWGGVVLAGAALFVAGIQVKRKKVTGIQGPIILWLLFAVFCYGAYPGRSVHSELWWYFLVPAVVLAGTALISRIARTDTTLALSCLAVLVGFGAQQIWHRVSYPPSCFDQKLVALFDEQFDEDTMIVDAFFRQRGPWQMCTRATFYRGANTIEDAHEIIREFHRGSFDKKRLVIWYMAYIDRKYSGHTTWFVEHGATHTSDGKSSFLVFELPNNKFPAADD